MTKFIYKTDFIDNEDENFYYLLGYFMTDGCCCISSKTNRHRVSISSNDIEHLKNINTYFCNSSLFSINRNCGALTICNKPIVQKLIDKGCVPNKSLILKFPNVPEKYLPDFIRGCIDGDGWVKIFKFKNYLTPEIGFCSSSIHFFNGFVAVLDNWEFTYSKYTIKKDNPNYRIHIRNLSNVKELSNKLYYPNHNFSMPRKKDIAYNIVHSFEKKNILGEKHWNSKLKEDDVRAIRLKYKLGMSQQKISIEFGVSRGAIQNILRGKTWKHIKDE